MYLKRINLLIILCLAFVCVKGKSKVIELNEDNWNEMMYGEWMVEFFAPWCPACKALQPIWSDFSSWSNDLGISVGKVDVTTSPGLSGRFMINALPTIFHIKDGEFRQYRGSRDKDEFLSFIEEKKWKSIETVPGWKSPASAQMGLVAQFFKLSMALRSVHTTMVEDYGFPNWVSYLVFAAATIIVGALLGLLLVCTIDFLFPPKAMHPIPPHPDNIKDKARSSDEEDSEDRDQDKENEEGSQDEEDKEDLEEAENEGEEEASGGEASQGENSEPEAISSSSSPSVRKRRARKED